MEVRTITGDELVGWVEANHVPFFVRAPAEREAELRRPWLDLDRVWAAFDQGAMVGTLRTFPTPVTTPGGEVAADALTNVGVSPTHRRRGVMSRMIEPTLRAAAERGEPVSILIAAEYPIYGRFGFGPATESANYQVDSRRARFREPPMGRIAMVEPRQAREVVADLYETVRPRQPGAIGRQPHRWDLALGLLDHADGEGWKGYCILHYPDGGAVPSGFLRYHADSAWEARQPRGTLFIDELLSATPAAYAALWRYACEIDWMISVKADDRRVDEPLPWLLEDARAMRQTSRHDFLWLRILDVPAALAGRRYATDGDIVLDVTDAMGLTGGRFLLQASAAGATCQPTTRSADVALDIGTLAAAYLGGTRVLTLHEVGKVDEQRPSAIAEMDALFQTPQPPWCNTWF